MAYRTRSARRMYRKTRHHFLATIIIITVLLFVTINWILPALINGLGFLRGLTSQPQKQEAISENTSLAPPILSIPFEATNSSQIDVSGFATAHSKVKIFVDEQLKSEVEAKDDGSFTAERIELSLGTNLIFGKTVDDQNQESLSSKAIKIILDNEKPTLIINEPEDNKKIQGGDKKVKVSGKTDVGAKILVNDNQIVVDKDGNFTNDLAINEGDNIVTVKAIDSATNTTEVQRKVTYTP